MDPKAPFELDLSRSGNAVSCRASGALVLRRGDELYRAVAPHLARGRSVRLSLGAITEADAVAAASLAALLDAAGPGGGARGAAGTLEILDLSPALSAQLERIPADRAPDQLKDEGFFSVVGAWAERAWHVFVAALVFHADAFFGCLLGLGSGKSRRRGAIWRDALALGADAVPVVATIGLLLGLILAFQGGHLMRDFGTSKAHRDPKLDRNTRQFVRIIPNLQSCHPALGSIRVPWVPWLVAQYRDDRYYQPSLSQPENTRLRLENPA